MLQKIVTQKYPSRNKTIEDDNASELEAILLQKDIQINELLEQITLINEILQRKNEELNKAKYDNIHFENMA